MSLGFKRLNDEISGVSLQAVARFHVRSLVRTGSGAHPVEWEKRRVCFCMELRDLSVKLTVHLHPVRSLKRHATSLTLRTFTVYLCDRRGTIFLTVQCAGCIYEVWNLNSGNYLFTTDTK